jgi:hypothetical protein
MRPYFFAIAISFVSQTLFAQGGPPMITDDPGTPGNGKWENNFAVIFEHRSGETSYDLPQFDLNYGVGEHIQLTLQTAPAVVKREGHGAIGGLGGTEAAVKWRMLDEEAFGFDLSTFPRIIFNIGHASVRRGLTEDGTRFQIPLEIAKKFGPWHADAEFGSLVSTVGRSQWLYGVVGGYDLTKTAMIMAELHGTSRTNFSQDDLVINFGLRYELTESRVIIVSLGHELRSPEDSLALIGYFGMQFHF